MPLFFKGPPPLLLTPAKGTRVRVGYHKRGPWFDAVVLESRGRIIKLQLDEAGVGYYVRSPKGWLDQELRAVIVAGPEHGEARATPASTPPAAEWKQPTTSNDGRARRRAPTSAGRRKLSRREAKEVTRAMATLSRHQR